MREKVRRRYVLVNADLRPANIGRRYASLAAALSAVRKGSERRWSRQFWLEVHAVRDRITGRMWLIQREPVEARNE